MVSQAVAAAGWIRSHWRSLPVVDRWITCGLLVLSVPVLFTDGFYVGVDVTDTPGRTGPLAFALAAAQAVPLFWRRRFPVVVLVIASLALALRVSADCQRAAGDLAFMVAFDAVGAYARRWRLPLGVVLGSALFFAGASRIDWGPEGSWWPTALPLWCVSVLLPTGVGVVRRVAASRSTRRDERPPARPEPPALFDKLTAREREIFALLSAGRSNPQIATELTLSPETVKWHVSNLLAKLGASHRYELMAMYYRATTSGHADEPLPSGGAGRERENPRVRG